MEILKVGGIVNYPKFGDQTSELIVKAVSEDVNPEYVLSNDNGTFNINIHHSELVRKGILKEPVKVNPVSDKTLRKGLFAEAKALDLTFAKNIKTETLIELISEAENK